jgi:predicted nucleotidyltransferase
MIPRPTQAEIVSILKLHPYIRLREKVSRAFLVGSQVTGNTRKPDEGSSDVDILLEVEPKPGFTSAELEEYYRQPLREYFVRNNIRGVNDSVHPQWYGLRVDVYFTYDASIGEDDGRARIQLEKK